LHHQNWITTSDDSSQTKTTSEPSIHYTKSVVVGLDISETSLLRHTSNVIASSLATPNSTTKQQSQQPLLTHSRIDLVHGDFFSDTKNWNIVQSFGFKEQQQPEKQLLSLFDTETKFDFIFDYTFFCAIHPSMRLKWGEQMSLLLKPNSGRLLTIIFPIIPNSNPLEGPPFPVTVDDYRAALEPFGIVMDQSTCTVAHDNNNVEGIMTPSPVRVNPNTVSRRVGKELVCWWIHRNTTGKI
jgi:Thiopurine S-methyltransferase (TPMT)